MKQVTPAKRQRQINLIHHIIYKCVIQHIMVRQYYGYIVICLYINTLIKIKCPEIYNLRAYNFIFNISKLFAQ
jgi:hypothetical protein